MCLLGISACALSISVSSQSTADSSILPSSLSYTALLDSAENLFNDSKWSEAASIYREALKMNPGSPLNSKIFANLGMCLTHVGDFDSALQSFEIALVKEPDSPRILTNKASLLLLMGNKDEATSLLDQSLRIDSMMPEALRLHGQLMLMSERLQEARNDFSRLCVADPSEAWGPAGEAEVLLAQNEFANSIPLLNKAINLREAPEFRISLIEAQLGNNRLADAENSIREALTLYPTQGEFYLLRALLNKTLHQNRQAEIDKKSAIEYGVDPQIVEKYLPTFSK